MHTHLNFQDLQWIAQRMPREVWKTLQKERSNVFLAGGFIRSCIANEPVSDLDLFTYSKESAQRMSKNMVDEGHGLKVITTDNAYTVIGLTYPVQFIHRWSFESPVLCVKSFDFTIARAAVWIGNSEPDEKPILSSFCDERFYEDLAAKRLVYCSPVRNEDAGGSMLRVLKFYQRGYRIPLNSLGAVIARMAKDLNMPHIENKESDGFPAGVESVEGRIAFVMTGMLREVDPFIDPNHTSHLPTYSGPK